MEPKKDTWEGKIFDENTKIEDVQDAIEKGDKVRILWALLMETLNMSIEHKMGDVIKAMKECLTKHNEACNIISGSIQNIKKRMKKQTQKT